MVGLSNTVLDPPKPSMTPLPLIDNSHIRNLVIDLFEAGTDTGALTLQWLILFLMWHPHEQVNEHRHTA
jgi:cytochrome P450